MTLIAAFRCEAGGHPAVVVCADSQETYGDYRVTVDKITPRDAGQCELIIGGAGNIAALIDGLAYAVEQNVKRWPAGLDEEDARLRVERVLLSYHARHVTHYPAELHDKVLRFIVCVRDKTTSQIYLWRTNGPTAERVGDYTILGWEEAIYQHEVKRLYHSGLTVAQAVFLGVHLFTIAKVTSNYVGGGTQVFVARRDGVWFKALEDVQNLERRIAAFNEALAELTLVCPDSSITQEEFQELILKFRERVVQLREHYAKRSYGAQFKNLPFGAKWKGELYIQFPNPNEALWADDGKTKLRVTVREKTERETLEEGAPLSDSQASEGNK